MPLPNPQPPTPNSNQLIIFDVDGVLTDGGLYVDDDGKPSKKFHVRDGLGIKLAQSVGLEVAVLTGKVSEVVHHRMVELGITHFIQGSKDKGTDVHALEEMAGVSLENTAYVGDDLIDLPAFAKVGYPIAVADAVAEVKEAAMFVTHAKGGHGAAREAIEHILKAQGKWGDVVAKFTG
ncbi:MAG: HAD-IIIA family hydrolase [Planctomycetota bacterium]